MRTNLRLALRSRAWGKLLSLSPCKAKPDPLAHARPRCLTRRRPRERWRPETAGVSRKSSAAPARPTGPSRNGTRGSAFRPSSRSALHLSFGRRPWASLSRRIAARKQWPVFRMRSRAWDRRSLRFVERSRGPVRRDRGGSGFDQPLSLFGPEPAPVCENAAGHRAYGGVVLRPLLASLRGAGAGD